MESSQKLIYENLDKGVRYYLTSSEFRNVEYVHLRKYYLDFEGNWEPSKEGVAIPASLANMYALLDGVIELCANSETLQALQDHVTAKLSSLKQNQG